MDGTENKAALGANAILAVSLAVSKAAAAAKGMELYEYLAELDGSPGRYSMPVPMMNILNGGEHADNSVDIQEFMVLPVGAQITSRKPCGCGTVDIFTRIRESVLDSREGMSTTVGDEGGLMPRICLPVTNRHFDDHHASNRTSRLRAGRRRLSLLWIVLQVVNSTKDGKYSSGQLKSVKSIRFRRVYTID